MNPPQLCCHISHPRMFLIHNPCCSLLHLHPMQFHICHCHTQHRIERILLLPHTHQLFCCNIQVQIYSLRRNSIHFPVTHKPCCRMFLCSLLGSFYYSHRHRISHFRMLWYSHLGMPQNSLQNHISHCHSCQKSSNTTVCCYCKLQLASFLWGKLCSGSQNSLCSLLQHCLPRLQLQAAEPMPE